jgi:TusA-related sulfurtransferase
MKEVTLDCLGEACPVPLVKAQKALEELEVGDVLVIQIDHSCAMKNVPEWAREDGHNVEIEEVDDGEWEVIHRESKMIASGVGRRLPSPSAPDRSVQGAPQC